MHEGDGDEGVMRVVSNRTRSRVYLSRSLEPSLAPPRSTAPISSISTLSSMEFQLAVFCTFDGHPSQPLFSIISALNFSSLLTMCTMFHSSSQLTHTGTRLSNIKNPSIIGTPI